MPDSRNARHGCSNQHGGGAGIMLAIAKAARDVTPNEAAYPLFVFGYGMLAHEARRRCASG